MERNREPLMPMAPKVAVIGTMLAGFGGAMLGLADVYAENLFGADVLDGSLHFESKFRAIVSMTELKVSTITALIWTVAGVASLSLDKKHRTLPKAVLWLSSGVFAADEYLILSNSMGGISDVDRAFWGGIAVMSGSRGIWQANKVLKGRI